MQKVSWFLRVSAVSALALILAAATVGSSAAADAAVAATAAPTVAAPAAPIVPVCVAAATISEVRVVHASPDAPNVDIYVDKVLQKVLTNVKFGDFTPYMGVTAGAHRVKITKAGDAKTIVFDQDVELVGQNAYTIIAEGTLANFAVHVLTDDVSNTAGMARVVVVHAIPDGPAVDVITTKDNKAIVSNLAFPNFAELNLDVIAMATAALPVPTAAATAKAGATAAATPAAPTSLTVDLAVVAHGDTKPVIALPKTTLKPDTIYTVIAIGLLTGDKTDKPVKPEALVLTSSSFAGFKAPAPAAASVDEAAIAATAAATAAAPAATKAATMAATAAAPTATKIPVGQQPASAGWALKTGTLRRISDNSRCVGVAGITVVGGPADVAGVKANDLVLSVDGVELTSAEQFQTIIGAKKSGDKLKLELQHADGSQSAVTLELGLNPFS